VKLRMVKLGLTMVAMIAGLTACMTSFQGSPHVEGGRAGCEAKCKGQGMAVAGMVYMGEYSSACVCQVPGVGGGHTALLDAAGAVSGAAVAVEMQRRRQQQQQQGGMYQHY
jgi:hypothetical protein